MMFYSDFSKRKKVFFGALLTLILCSNINSQKLRAQEIVDLDPSVMDQADVFFENQDQQLSDTPPVQAQLPKPPGTTQNVKAIPVIKDVTLGDQQPVSENIDQPKSVTLSKLEIELLQKEKKLNDALANLQKTQSRLHLAEAESQRLSKILDNSNQKVLSTYSPNAKVSNTVTQVSAVKPQLAMQGAATAANTNQESSIRTLAPSSASEMLIATVLVEKANLRSGPGKNNSPLMSISKGTRLAIETRSGEWYRVITPTGARAWIAANVVAFGNRMQDKPSRVVRVKGYDNEAFSMENEARELIHQMQRE